MLRLLISSANRKEDLRNARAIINSKLNEREKIIIYTCNTNSGKSVANSFLHSTYQFKKLEEKVAKINNNFEDKERT